MVTLKDVASKAGVSATTVSIIVNGKGEEKRIPQATIDRVMKTVEELNYRPDQNARRLRSNAEKRINIALFWPGDYRVNLLGHLATSIKNELYELNPNTELAIQTYKNDSLSAHDSIIRSGVYDGIIIGALSTADLEYIEKVKGPTPVVLINRKSVRHSTVGVDNSQLGLQAAALIRQKGYTEVAMIMNSGRYIATKERTDSFLSSCMALDIQVEERCMFDAPGSLKGGYEASMKYAALSDRPRMLFCEDDYMAQGALAGLYKSGLRIPRDLEVLSFGMMSNSQDLYLIPSLSTISLPYNDIDREAAKIILEMIKDPTREISHVLYKPEVHLRESFTI